MKKIISVFGLVFLLSSCASTTQYVKSSGDNNTGNKTASETLTKIYVLRPSSWGSAITFKIYQDEIFIGELGPRSYLSWEVDPTKGEISIISKSENYFVLKVTPKVGKTYYLKQKVKMGWVMARTELEWIPEEVALEMLKKLKNPKIKDATQ